MEQESVGGRGMKRILIILAIVALLLCGCGKNETEETEKRFVIEYQQMFNVWGNCCIIRDTETGKAYLFAKNGYAGGLTILEEGEDG